MTDRLRLDDLEAFLLGATLLGSGGGGEPGIWAHRIRWALDRSSTDGIELLDLAEAAERGLHWVAPVGMIGATSVLTEKLPHGSEIAQAVAVGERWHRRRVDALIPVEAAGLNAALAVSAAAELGLPLIDVDLMGRALPRFDQLSLSVDDPPSERRTVTTVALAETVGPVLVLDGSSADQLERAVRAHVAVAGGWAGAAFGPVPLDLLPGRCCPGTLARAVVLGRALSGLAEGADPGEVAGALGGVCAGGGRVLEVSRGRPGRPNRSSITVAGGSPTGTGPVLRVEAENEYLVVLRDGEPLVTCPDLVVALDRRLARPVAVDQLRVGADIAVLGLPGADWWWERPARLAAVGPRAFGIDLDPLRVPVGAVR